MSEFFTGISKIPFEGKGSTNPMAFKYYNPEEIVGGKTMREQLKFALSWWHTMGGDGTDMFGVGTTDKKFGGTDPMDIAKKKVDAAFELMDLSNKEAIVKAIRNSEGGNQNGKSD